MSLGFSLFDYKDHTEVNYSKDYFLKTFFHGKYSAISLCKILLCHTMNSTMVGPILACYLEQCALFTVETQDNNLSISRLCFEYVFINCCF